MKENKREVKDINCRKPPYRGVLKKVHQDLCQNGRVVTMRAVYKALYRGDQEVQEIFWEHVTDAEREAEERQKRIDALKKQSTNETAAVVS